MNEDYESRSFERREARNPQWRRRVAASTDTAYSQVSSRQACPVRCAKFAFERCVRIAAKLEIDCVKQPCVEESE